MKTIIMIGWPNTIFRLICRCHNMRDTENFLWWIYFCLKLSAFISNLKLLVYGLFFQIVSRIDLNISLWYVKLQSCSTTKMKWITIIYRFIQIYKFKSSKVRSLQYRIRRLVRVHYVLQSYLTNSCLVMCVV